MMEEEEMNSNQETVTMSNEDAMKWIKAVVNELQLDRLEAVEMKVRDYEDGTTSISIDIDIAPKEEGI